MSGLQRADGSFVYATTVEQAAGEDLVALLLRAGSCLGALRRADAVYAAECSQHLSPQLLRELFAVAMHGPRGLAALLYAVSTAVAGSPEI